MATSIVAPIYTPALIGGFRINDPIFNLNHRGAIKLCPRQPIHSTHMAGNTIIRLPNGAAYDINQTENADVFPGPIVWTIDMVPIGSDRDLSRSVVGELTNVFSNLTGLRQTLFGLLRSSVLGYTYTSIATRVESFSVTAPEAYDYAFGAMTFRFIPRDDTWTLGT